MFLLERILFYLFFFIGMPTVVFFFIRAIQKDKGEVERLRAQKELLELEVRREEARAKTLVEENKKYDRLIAEDDKKRDGEAPGDSPP